MAAIGVCAGWIRTAVSEKEEAAFVILCLNIGECDWGV
jgi:hypothetical protein